MTCSLPEEHKQHLRLVLEYLSEHILINPAKSVSGVEHLDFFLGHRVDSQGMRSLEEKVQVIREFFRFDTQRKF